MRRVIKLRRESCIKTIFLRILLYSMFIVISTLLLYLLHPSIEKRTTIYFVYVAIVLILAFYTQFLVYTISLGKSVSLALFKDTILDKELENPVIFLFPEFEVFYRPKDSVYDKIDNLELEKIAQNILDGKENSLEIENNFKEFIKENLEELLKYDVVITMRRKGSAIFDNVVETYPQLEKLIPIPDNLVISKFLKIKDRNVLIFDDSIHHGETARKIIGLVGEIGCENVLYVTVISQIETLRDLEEEYKEYKNIKFLQFMAKSEEEYRKFYADYMFAYLDHVNSSLNSLNDHTLIKLKIEGLVEKNALIELLNEKHNYVYDVERLIEKNNEYKISLECPWIYDKLQNTSVKKIKMDMVKIRFFVKLNRFNDPYGTTEINLSPVLIPREFSVDCNKFKLGNICMLKNEMMNNKEKEEICINCLMNNLTRDFVEEFMKYFEDKLQNKGDVSIIEKKILYRPPYENIFK